MARRQSAPGRFHAGPAARLAALCCLSAVWPAASVGPNSGGHFRSGSIAWTKLEGNTVQFELLSSWKRSHSAHLVHGTPAHGRIFLGDVVRVGGQVTPRLDFGDGGVAYIDVEVTAFDEVGDWFSGVSIITHTYATPNNGWRILTDRYGDNTTQQGQPWFASFSGCCRWEGLLNEANEAFDLPAVFDLVHMTGSPAARALQFTTACDSDASTITTCKLPGLFSNNKGPCVKVPFTSVECGSGVSDIGKTGGFVVVSKQPQLASVVVHYDGTIRTPDDMGGGCMSPGLRTLGLSVRDSRVGYIRIKNAGSNCPPSGTLQVAGATRVNGAYTNMQGTFESENGRIVRATVTNRGSGYLTMPAVSVNPQFGFPCTGAALEVGSFETVVNVLVGSITRHSKDCYDKAAGNTLMDCDPDVPGKDVRYTGTVIPQWWPGGFPQMGWGWDAKKRQVVQPAAGFDETDLDGGTGLQDAHSHVVAYAGYDLTLTFKASANWCQWKNMRMMKPEFLEDPRCIVKGSTVSFKYGPLPRGAHFSMHQEGAITDLLITYDNPFEAHRPQHEWAVNKLKRDYVNHPNSVQAAQLGFTRVDFNLNSGVGGASVYLWFKKYDPASSNTSHGMEAITHLNVSTSAQEEAHFQQEGYTKLDGNLNEQAGGNEVFIWYKKSSGHAAYVDHRETQMGLEQPITNITFWSPTSPAQDDPTVHEDADTNPYFDGVQRAPGWVIIPKSLNAGTVSNSPINLAWRRSHMNPISQTMTWRPCSCDVGRQYICAAPQTSELDTTGLDWVTGEQRCVAVDVLPDRVPEWRTPKPNQVMEFYIGRETRYPISVLVLNPDKEVEIEAELPPGAVLDVMTHPASNCSDIGLCYARSRDLAWTPAWNQGGLTSTVCFKATDIVTGCEPEGQPHESHVCATLKVIKCAYAINFEQHLQELASLYKTDWLNIFSMNPTIKTPDRVLYAGQVVNIGHLYQVVPGDTVHKIAQVRQTARSGSTNPVQGWGLSEPASNPCIAVCLPCSIVSALIRCEGCRVATPSNAKQLICARVLCERSDLAPPSKACWR